MKTIKIRALAFLMILCVTAALPLGTAWAADDAGKDHNILNTVQWSFPTITDDEYVTPDTYRGKVQILVFFKADGSCGKSNSTIRSLAQADWIKSDEVQVIAVGCGPDTWADMSKRQFTISFKEKYAPDCEDIVFCYNGKFQYWGTKDPHWDAIEHLEEMIQESGKHPDYAVNCVYDRENYLRFYWSGGYRAAAYEDALERLGIEVSAPVTAPAPTPAPAIPATGTAYPSTQSVDLDGNQVEFQMYALKDANGSLTNYVKVRDLALALNDTKARFSVGWDGAVNLVSGSAYTATGTENSTPFSGERTFSQPASPTKVNGSASDLRAIVLTDDNGGDYTYYQLRDLGRKLGFNVGWSAERGVFIESGKPYSE